MAESSKLSLHALKHLTAFAPSMEPRTQPPQISQHSQTYEVNNIKPTDSISWLLVFFISVGKRVQSLLLLACRLGITMARKKALIIGINYFGTEHQLNGCINDANNVREFLVNERGFSASTHDMVFMTDAPENQGTPFYPTGANMMAAFQWLTSYNKPGDVLWLSYSGHGGNFN
jgi:hypothetical protein